MDSARHIAEFDSRLTWNVTDILHIADILILPFPQVWIWCAMPFPKGSRREHDNGSEANAHFWFFLVFYYGLYCAIGESTFQSVPQSLVVHDPFSHKSYRPHLHHPALFPLPPQLVASGSRRQKVVLGLLAPFDLYGLRHASSRPRFAPLCGRLVRIHTVETRRRS